MIENKQEVVFPQLRLWFSFYRNYLQEDFQKGLSKLVESGLYDYQNHYLEIVNQHTALTMFVKESGFNRSWNLLSLVNQMISKHIPLGWYSSKNYRLSESVGSGDYGSEEVAQSLDKFKDLFLFCAVLQVMLIPVIIIEISWKKIILVKLALKKLVLEGLVVS